MHTLEFTKMHGAGNDFLLVETALERLNAETIAKLCDRHRGIGADGLIHITPPENGAPGIMHFFNCDGSAATMCGNGLRCVCAYLKRRCLLPNPIHVQTESGLLSGDVLAQNRVEITLNLRRTPCRTAHGFCCDTGVPHRVMFVPDANALLQPDALREAPGLRWETDFDSAGCNVNFVACNESGTQALFRTFERGVEGETQACGTGAAAVFAVLRQEKGIEHLTLSTRFGDTFYLRPGTAPDQIRLNGPVEFIAEGTFFFG